MTIQTILVTVVGCAVGNMVMSAVQNHFDGDDVGKSARSGLTGGIAGGIFACFTAVLGILNQ